MNTADLAINPPDCTGLAVLDGIGTVVQNALANQVAQRYLDALNEGVFYCEIRNYILYESLIDKWMKVVVGNISTVVMLAAVTFVTLWIAIAGFKLISGTSREPVITLLWQGAKIVLVMSLITGLTKESGTVIHKIYELRNDITAIILNDDVNISQLIDANLAAGQVAKMIAEDMAGASAGDRGVSSSSWMQMAGQAGPPILTSILVMISEVAIAISMMLAPLFLFFLLFKPTASLFWGWLKFVASTFITLAFLGIVASIALEGTMKYGVILVVSQLLNTLADAKDSPIASALATAGLMFITGGAERADIASGATRLGAMGAMFSVLIIAVPPVVMQLFGSAMGYAQSILSGIYSPMARSSMPQQQGSAGAAAAPGTPGANGHSSAPPQLSAASPNAAPTGALTSVQNESGSGGNLLAQETARHVNQKMASAAGGGLLESGNVSSWQMPNAERALVGGAGTVMMGVARMSGMNGMALNTTNSFGLQPSYAGTTATTGAGSSATTFAGSNPNVSSQSSADTLVRVAQANAGAALPPASSTAARVSDLRPIDSSSARGEVVAEATIPQSPKAFPGKVGIPESTRYGRINTA